MSEDEYYVNSKAYRRFVSGQADLIIDLQLNQTVGSYHPVMSSRLNSGCLFLLLFLMEFWSFLNSGQKMRGFLISILINQLKNSLAPRDSQYQIQSSALLSLSDCHISAQIVFVPLYSSQKHRQQIKPTPLPH